ncbi:MAG TPA: tetratricopeptide repeat protein, partial [Ilumatobacteraceae bacterium]|nr:tetratricopeptide repeat protein [Ilumatobacteraceae bacterium]
TAGVPDAVEDGEGRILAVGRTLVEADLQLPIRVGVNTGHVFAGEVGAAWRRVYTVMGDAVNLAARLMAKAGPGEVIASRVTLDHTSTPFATSALEPFMVKGKRHPQHASSVGQRFAGRGRDLAALSFVGRVDELTRLSAAMTAALTDEGAVAEIVGEAGIGKSRLVRELIARASGARVVRVTCEPFASDRPYFMARVILRTGLNIPLEASADEAGAQLIDWLRVNGRELLPFAPLLAVALDADVAPTSAVDDLGPDYRAAKLREVAAATLHLAFDHPLMLVVEDAMWMDEASSLLLANALQVVGASRWFGCLTTRDPSQGLSARLGFESTVTELTPLDARLAAHLAAQLTDDADVPHSDLLELCARAKGNPLFLLELAHARRDLGSLDAMPGTLEDLIAARIDRLSPADRNLLRHAAVLGDRFVPELFDRTLGDRFPTPVPWERVSDFLVVDQGELRFSHDLVRRVAYSGLPFHHRRQLHLRIGHALIPQGDPDDARLGLLALHFHGSGDHALAWKYNRMAGQRAWDNYATLEATAFFERAITNARPDRGIVDQADLAATYEAMADVALLAGRFDLAREGLRGARWLRAGDRRAIARLCRKEGKLRERLGRYGAAERWFRQSLRTLETCVDSSDSEVAADRAELQVEWASFSIMRQKYRPGVRWCRRALVDAVASGDRRTEAHVYYLLEWALAELGDDEAHRYRDLAQPIYEDVGDYVGLGAVLLNRGVDALAAGRWEEASSSFEEARRAYQRGGDVVSVAHAAHNLAEVYIEQGRHEEAEACLRESRRIWRASGFAMGLAAVTSALGRTMARSGRTDEAVDLLRDALRRFEALEHAPFVAESRARLAEAYVFGQRWHEALDIVDELGDTASVGGPAIAALANRMRGIALAAVGDVDAARDVLEQTRDFAEKAGIEWESALTVLELARLPGTPPDEREILESRASLVLKRMGVVEAVVPPSATPYVVSAG